MKTDSYIRRPWTAQEVFDHAAKHLIKQGRQAMGRLRSEGCVYLDAEGRRCAVGCFMRPGEHTPQLEGLDVGEVARRLVWSHLVKHLDLLTDLQQAHDVPGTLVGMDGSVDFRPKLRWVALEHDLSAEVLDV